MIQFNLLPDVKLDYIKARRTKRMVMMTSLVAAGVCLLITGILFAAVNGFQKMHLKNLSKDIDTYSQQLKEVPDLDKILTVQNQLGSLPELHNKKVVATRLFDYLSQVTPTDASLTDLDVDFVASTMTFKGTANSLSTVNKYADTLKFTTYGNADKTVEGKAFIDVVLSSFARDDDTTSYEMTMKFDPLIFDSANKITLAVPNIISTRSATEKPAALFQEDTTNEEAGQ